MSEQEDVKPQGNSESETSELLCFYVTFRTEQKYSWRITTTNLDLDRACELEKWIIDTEEKEGHDIVVTYWKRLKT